MLASTILERAMRMLTGNRRPLGSAEAARVLEAFQSLITDLPGTLGARWIDVPMETNYTAGEDERVTMLTSGLTITLPTLVYMSGEGVATGVAYDSACMRSPMDGARVMIVDQADGSAEMHFWRSDRGEWVAATGLELTSECPLPAAMDRFMPAILAQDLEGEYGVQLADSIRSGASLGWRRLRSRYGARKAVSVERALLVSSRQSYGGRWTTGL